MTKVYLILTNTGSVLSTAIKVVSRQPYNHISLAFDDELEEVYSFGRRQAHNPFIGGFVREDMASDFFRNATCQIYAIPVTKKEYAHLKSMVQMFEAEADYYHYNFAGLITAFLGIEWTREQYFFCSQFVGECLKSAGVLNTEAATCLMHPQQIVDALNAPLLYEGVVSDRLGLPATLPYFLRMMRMIG